MDKIYKKLVDSNTISKKTQRHLKPVGTRPGIMSGSWKGHKKCFDGCPPFWPILSALQTPTYKFAKFIVSSLEPLTTNKYAVKDSLNFATEIAEQDSSNFMGSFDIYLLFTYFPLEETIEICANDLFLKKGIVYSLKKSEFEDLLSWARKEWYFTFNNILYKQIDGVAMGLH